MYIESVQHASTTDILLLSTTRTPTSLPFQKQVRQNQRNISDFIATEWGTYQELTHITIGVVTSARTYIYVTTNIAQSTQWCRKWRIMLVYDIYTMRSSMTNTMTSGMSWTMPAHGMHKITSRMTWNIQAHGIYMMTSWMTCTMPAHSMYTMTS